MSGWDARCEVRGAGAVSQRIAIRFELFVLLLEGV